MSPDFNITKTRIAPTPSGYLHLGNILSFVITLGLAEKKGGQVLLRIDDMDRDRADAAFIEDIFRTLRFLNIPWQDGPADATDFEHHFAQRHRMPLYNAALQQLINDEHVFACTCSRKQVLQQNPAGFYEGTCLKKGLPLDTPNSALRIKMPVHTNIQVNTSAGGQTVTEIPPELHYFVVRKRDGFPAYQLSSLIDDVHFGINLVVRGADLWPSTLAQLYLAQLLQATSFSNAAFVHHPLIIDDRGNKMSKSAGATSVYQMRNAGRSATDIYAAIAQLVHITTPVQNWQQLSHALAGQQKWGL